MSNSFESPTTNPYIERINAVIDYINAHITTDLPLNVLAEKAAFSPFHFHRIFKSITGETVNQFVNRLRLERAAALLKGAPSMSILDAATACGFNSASVFSRSFKKHFGIPPRTWDRITPLKNSKNGQVLDGFPRYTVEQLAAFEGQASFPVVIESLPARQLAYIRIRAAYNWERNMRAYHTLLNWYQRQGGDIATAQMIGMSPDDPTLVPLEKYQYDWCVIVPDSWQASGEISMRPFPACTIASVVCDGDIYLVDKIWQYLFDYWLPRSRYQPDNLPAMEIFLSLPHLGDFQRWHQRCALPITDLYAHWTPDINP
ncbi:MAG: helix-turn-helix domain-containing protein [Anaerolineae bacterium]|nr:helix-turn-helix domain-containing protein [Anaerolineae bacterium]MCA9888686.1 helix-turn-helix domain-containing protein [Anaerolineae bacterium]